MIKQPIWEIIRECAREFTQAGKVPFTRRDLISCVQSSRPGVDENSINPIIQGLTDNLKGGAPGAEGKKILHSVGRGRFVLYSKRDSYKDGVAAIASSNKSAATKQSTIDENYTSENQLRDHLLNLLNLSLDKLKDLTLIAEGALPYKLPDGSELQHKSDILISRNGLKKFVSIELKYQSAVTDQFKCRAYDAIHLKKEFGDNLLTVLLFAKTNKGISIAQAKRISYPFDVFLGLPANEIGKEFIEDLAQKIIIHLG